MTPKTKKPSTKLTHSSRISLTALSLLGLLGGWNMIARLEKQEVQADESTPLPLPVVGPTSIPPSPTPWPTVQPLAELPPIPTLVPTLTTQGQNAVNLAPLPLISLPTPVALPTLAPLPALPTPPPPPPPPPPVPIQPAPNWNQSGGS